MRQTKSTRKKPLTTNDPESDLESQLQRLADENAALKKLLLLVDSAVPVKKRVKASDLKNQHSSVTAENSGISQELSVRQEGSMSQNGKSNQTENE